MSLNVTKFFDDSEKPCWNVERRSKINGRVIHETIAHFDNGRDAEEYRKELLSTEKEQ